MDMPAGQRLYPSPPTKAAMRLALRQIRDRLRYEVAQHGGVRTVSNRLGIARQSVYNWLEGTHAPDAANLVRLRDVLGTDLAWLLGGADPLKTTSKRSK